MKPPKLKPANNHARLICRVSSEKQRENYSIPQQERRGKEYSDQKLLRVTTVRRMVESASKPGRKQWEEVLEEAVNGPETHILIPKVDRSLRNADDLAIIVNFPKRHPDKVLHFFDDGLIHDKNSNANVVFALMIQGAQATWEAARIAERTKAGLEQKALEGGWPNRPPFGYRTFIDPKATERRHAKRLAVVPEEARWIVRIYELAATGQHSLETIAQTIRHDGCKRLSRSQVAYVIRNALYAGFVEWPKNSGNLIKGRHEPIISWDLRKRSIAGLERHNKPQYGSRDYRFKGLIRCERCQCSVVGDAKKKMTSKGERIYIYYRCGRNSPHRKCNTKGYVTEEVIETQVLQLLLSIQLTPGLVTQTMGYLEQAAQFDASESIQNLSQLSAEQKRVENRKENALDFLADKTPNPGDWEKKIVRYNAQLLDLEAAIKRLEETEPSSYMAIARRTLELGNTCETLYKSMPDEKRRELLASLHSNLLLDGKKLMPAWRKPFDIIAKLASCSNPLPQKYLEGNKFCVEKSIIKCLDVLPDLEMTPLGGRLRFLRKRQGLTQVDLARRTGISAVTICTLERGGGATYHPEIVGKLLAYFGREAAEAFPEGIDGVDHFLPVTDFGSWLRNFRVRKGLQQVELAKLLGVCKASVSAYEQNQTRPKDAVLKRLRKAFKLNGEFDRFL